MAGAYQLRHEPFCRRPEQRRPGLRPLDLSFLFTYRVDAGTVFYIEYDDRYQQADQIERDTNGDGIDDRFFFTTDVKRTNRAVFTKLQYLFRY